MHVTWHIPPNWSLSILGNTSGKKKFLGHCLNYFSPLPISGNLYLFFERQKQSFERMTEKRPMMIMTAAMVIMMVILIIMMTKITKKHTNVTPLNQKLWQIKHLNWIKLTQILDLANFLYADVFAISATILSSAPELTTKVILTFLQDDSVPAS